MLNRRGISLPLVIILMAMLALAVTVGFARVSEERHIIGDQRAQIDAFSVAQSGLELFLAGYSGTPINGDSVAISLTQGDTAHVRVWLVRAPVGATPGLYLVRSRGVAHAARAYDARTPAAQRTVAQYATWSNAAMDVDAAWTSVAGLAKDGTTGLISGVDFCSEAPTVNGAAVPHRDQSGFDGYRQVPPPGTPVVPQGLPDNVHFFEPWNSTPWTVGDSASINWDGIVTGSDFAPDYSLSGTSGWPLSFDTWPTIRVTAGSVSFSSSHSGKGIIAVTGDATFDNNFTWRGPVLVGGRANVQNATIQGAVISGLNFKRGFAPPVSDAGQMVSVQYDSCALDSALTRFARLQPVNNAWTDSWPEN